MLKLRHQASACVSPFGLLHTHRTIFKLRHLVSTSVSPFRPLLTSENKLNICSKKNYNNGFQELNIPTLDSPNWGTYLIHLQAAACILDLWELIKGEALGMSSQTYNLLPIPTTRGVPPFCERVCSSKSHLEQMKHRSTWFTPRHNFACYMARFCHI